MPLNVFWGVRDRFLLGVMVKLRPQRYFWGGKTPMEKDQAGRTCMNKDPFGEGRGEEILEPGA